MASHRQFYRLLAQPAAFYSPAQPPLISISRTGWRLGGCAQSWADAPRAIMFTGLWAFGLLAAGALIAGGAAV